MFSSHSGTSINPPVEEFNKTQSTEENTIAEQSNIYLVFKFHEQARDPKPLTGLAPDLSIRSNLKESGLFIIELYTNQKTSSFENAGNTSLKSRGSESEFFYHIVDVNQKTDLAGKANFQLTLRELDVYYCEFSNMTGFIRQPVKSNQIPSSCTEAYDLVGKFEPCGVVSSLSDIFDHSVHMEPFSFEAGNAILLVSNKGTPRIHEKIPEKMPPEVLCGEQCRALATPEGKLTDIQHNTRTSAGDTGKILESIARARQAYLKRKMRVERKIREVTAKARSHLNSP